MPENWTLDKGAATATRPYPTPVVTKAAQSARPNPLPHQEHMTTTRVPCPPGAA